MCGFSGFYSFQTSSNNAINLLEEMGSKILHRGPDDGGVWFIENEGLGFSHRRLAIVDLSPAGHQPMTSASERFVIAFNGEIYNHLDLRNQLESVSECIWNGHSDTETLLKGFDVWGIEQTIKKATGMFSIAVWDHENKQLTLVRDRLGEKPLYFGWQGTTLLFGSELSALKVHPDFSANINRQAICLLMRQGFISAPYSIYEDIGKLMPGTMITFSAQCKSPKASTYWSINDIAEKAHQNLFTGTADEAVSELESKLGDAVERQMMADVPLGAFLSGGIDSSTIVALMQSRSTRPAKSFSIGFHEEGYNEAQHAKAVAKHLGTEHTEYYVKSEDAMAVVPALASMYSEPFADSSQIPTYLVSKMAREHVTVALSGDGGDELFCGYGRYNKTANTWNKIRHIPMPLRSVAAMGLKSVPTKIWDAMLPKRHNIGDQIHKGAGALDARNFESFYYNYLMAHTRDPASLVIDGSDPLGIRRELGDIEGLGLHEKMMLMDINSYLPDDILCKVDRASMAVSLETRVPLLDHNVVEFAATIPMSIKQHNGENKWPLKQVLFKYVPRELIERPKKGFGIPLEHWLRTGLKEWASELLDDTKIRQQGFFHPVMIQNIWKQHQDGSRNWAYLLWNVLMFQSWYEKNH